MSTHMSTHIGRTNAPETRPEALGEIVEASIAKGLVAAGRGSVTTLVPELASAPAEAFGFAIALLNGTTIVRGDTATFSLQSITKLFALVALLREEPQAWNDVGWEPTEQAFRSLAELEARNGQPKNPFVNAGALVVTDMLHSRNGDGLHPTLELIRELSGNPSIRFSNRVARSEQAHAHSNSAIAHLLAEAGRIQTPIPTLLRAYFRQCAIEASAEDTARAALFLAAKGQQRHVLDFENRRRVNAVLLTAGMYNAAGDLAYRIGIPVKSGIGGGIVGVLPGVGSVCVWSPPLDGKGNSIGGLAALEHFSRSARWSIF